MIGPPPRSACEGPMSTLTEPVPTAPTDSDPRTGGGTGRIVAVLAFAANFPTCDCVLLRWKTCPWCEQGQQRRPSFGSRPALLVENGTVT